jgi:hypothetical protein
MPILTETFRGFPQFLQAHFGIVTRLYHYRFLPIPFQFIIHLSPIRRYIKGKVIPVLN